MVCQALEICTNARFIFASENLTGRKKFDFFLEITRVVKTNYSVSFANDER